MHITSSKLKSVNYQFY